MHADNYVIYTSSVSAWCSLIIVVSSPSQARIIIKKICLNVLHIHHKKSA